MQCWVRSCRFRIIFYWQQPKEEKKDYEWMILDIYKKSRTKNSEDSSSLGIFFSYSLILLSFVVVRVGKSYVKETRWWYTIRNNSNRDGRQIEREKSMYDEQVLFLFFYLFVFQRSYSVRTYLSKRLCIIENARLFVNKINWCTYAKGSRSNVIWHLI